MDQFKEILLKYNWPLRTEKPKTTCEEIEEFLKHKLPEDYKKFLQTFSGYDNSIGPEYVSLWDIDEIIGSNVDLSLMEYLPNTLGIGSNGSGECIAMEYTSEDNYRIVLTPFLFEKECHIEIGSSFTDFLIRLENGEVWFKETKKEIETLIQLVYDWAKTHEELILKEGLELTADQQIDAFLAGVKDPKKVRILNTNLIPFPDSLVLKSKLDEFGILNNNTFGLTLGFGIYIKSGHYNKRSILVHEFAHVMQYEKLGLKDFLFQYISECLSVGYPLGSLEVEANKIAKKICS